MERKKSETVEEIVDFEKVEAEKRNLGYYKRKKAYVVKGFATDDLDLQECEEKIDVGEKEQEVKYRAEVERRYLMEKINHLNEKQQIPVLHEMKVVLLVLVHSPEQSHYLQARVVVRKDDLPSSVDC